MPNALPVREELPDIPVLPAQRFRCMNDREQACLAAIVARLDADERYDVLPSGSPPISTGQYRQIARAVVFLDAEAPTGPIARTPDEAYLDGQRRMIGEIRKIVAVVLKVPPPEVENPADR